MRVQVVDRRTAFDGDPDSFGTAVEANQNACNGGWWRPSNASSR